ncbi:hypothetical protein XH88_27175 [Bradyrhizobium sp. CCBAU 51627]|nr:hypothetical protein [Bradyrhizobium sp. CCBAU 51627]
MSHAAEERQQVQPQAVTITLHPLGAPLPLGDDLLFLQELVSRLSISCAAGNASLALSLIRDTRNPT